ncbi:MAG: sulfatase-like hydrolase/transferase [Candidatus Omnitrophica bacterium]|nr:sulfatase-like hydrolase/transferase [Candidatus Omnitrophota bacterium]
MKTSFYLSLITCLATLISPASHCEDTAEKPNILLVMVDDLGPEWIGCYGAEGIETPNIDRLAEEGMLFTRAYSMPKCTPTRATLLTGQYPFRHGWVNHWDVPRWGDGCHFDPNQNFTFARVLRNEGYQTAIAGKWQINDFRVQPKALAEHGFNEWCMWTGYETGNPPSAERYWDPYIHTNDGSRTYEGQFGPDIYTDFLIDFMERNQNSPMLLYFPMCLTHAPFVPTPDEPNASGNEDCFKAMVRYTDKLVGRLVQALEQLGIRDRTYVFFTTDNGTAGSITGRLNGRKVRGGKGKLTENGIREPFIVSCPGKIPAGSSTEALTDFTDLFPTFLNLAGAEAPEGWTIDGHSLADVLHGTAARSPRDWVLSMGGGEAKFDGKRVIPEKGFADRAICGERYKIIYTDNGTTSLFDLERDPGEGYNLLDNPPDEAAQALEKFEAVARSFPERDAAPRYKPNPRQEWDLSLKR